MQKMVKDKARNCKIMVVGDVMLDKYYYGEVNRISPEAPVPINHVISEKRTLGGAANVAHNLALLGCETCLAGYIGDDFHAQDLLDKLEKRGIDYWTV
jgi:D-beta-D-heptose 7-phosphate kinase/D-beta-D-heptose 1-phosphate adenosyltransferase